MIPKDSKKIRKAQQFNVTLCRMNIVTNEHYFSMLVLEILQRN